MNHTKKRAAKRSSKRVRKFSFPKPLTRVHLITNLRAYREHYKTTLIEASTKVRSLTTVEPTLEEMIF